MGDMRRTFTKRSDELDLSPQSTVTQHNGTKPIGTTQRQTLAMSKTNGNQHEKTGRTSASRSAKRLAMTRSRLSASLASRLAHMTRLPRLQRLPRFGLSSGASLRVSSILPLFLSLFLSAFLSGCFFSFGTGGLTISGGTNPDSGTSVTPCFEDGCAEKVTIATVGDAENLIFTSTGRLFVTGGQNVFEITKDSGGNFVSTVVSAASCNFTGLAILQNTLFAACFDGTLWAGSLSQTPFRLNTIATIAGVNAGNGLVDGPDGNTLYLVNGPTGNTPRIVRIRLNPSLITQVQSSSDWLTSGLSFPNGLQRRGSTLFYSDSDTGSLGRIRSVPILGDGNPGTVTLVASFNSLPDDFTFIGNDIATALYSTGQIARINPSTGQTTQVTGMNRFDSPSQVRLAQGPMFRSGDLLVTEKGIIGENISTVGNRLTLYRTR